MLVWRICQQKYATFDGEGGRRAGGRWHRKGIPVIYTSDTLALAALEYFVRLNPGDSDTRLVTVSANIPDNLVIQRVSAKDLPKNWSVYPAPEILQKIGGNWFQTARSAVLAVPSAIIPQQTNYLIDPNHVDFKRIRVNKPEFFEFDPRMWK